MRVRSRRRPPPNGCVLVVAAGQGRRVLLRPCPRRRPLADTFTSCAKRTTSLMVMSETELSQAAYDRLKAELDDLPARGRDDIARLIEKARELGDLSENGDYHAAKDDQGKMEARIRQIQAMLDHAVIVESGGADAVATGSIVTIR